MQTLTVALALVAILCLAAIAHASAGTSGQRENPRLLESRAMPLMVFAATFIVLWCAWATWSPLPRVQDEMAYVLQAEIFAHGRWALPSPPLPAFWEQPHVLVEPVLTSKYFPGHSLLLSVGVRAGWPPLIPLVLGACSGMLLFILGRRVASGAVAFLAWSIWLFMPMVLYFGPSYFSELTTTACWLAGWYSLLEWRAKRRTAWLVGVAFFAGWCGITRPLTGVAYAIPIAVVVLKDVVRGRWWRQFAIAFATGSAVVAILPIWSAHTTGDWRLTPQTLYTRMYMPYDVPGFGFRTTPPTREITPEIAQLNRDYGSSHVQHTPSRLPSIIVDRAKHYSAGLWGTTAGVASIFALLGLLTLRTSTAFAIISGTFLFLTYLLYATPAGWTLYYWEATPAFAYLTAAGIGWAASLIGRPRNAPSDVSFSWNSPRWTRALLAVSAVFTLSGLITLKVTRGQHLLDRRFVERFARVVDTIPDSRAILFVRHSAKHSGHVTYVRNVSDLTKARVWVVYDRGDTANAQLLGLAPGRAAYLYDENVGNVARYAPQ